jgi:hypothetical protein
MDASLSFESYLEGAKKAAHRAMDEHGRGDYGEFALQAGVTVERLAKAVLISKNPIYIAEMRGGAEMLFHLGGHRTAKKVRTIGASEAVARLRMLDILAPDQELDLLIEVRNGVAHATSGDQAKSLLPTLAKTVEILLKDLGGPLNAFWGRWTGAARVAVDDRRTKIDRDVQVRIKQAKHRFDDRFSDLPASLKKRVRTDQSPHLDYAAVSVTGDGLAVEKGTACPACGSRAVALSLNQGTNESPQFAITALRCPMCYLKLTSRDELEAAGVKTRLVDAQIQGFTRSMLTLPPAPGTSLHTIVEQYVMGDVQTG